MTELAIDLLVFDDTCYPRIARDEDRVKQLADMLAADQSLPPIIVERGTHLVLGGWHTVGAYLQRGATLVPVKLVDVKPDERLIFAYRQDATSALPYRDVDVRKVARLEYERRRRMNGGVTIEELVTDLGRSRSTVHRWITDLIERDEREREHQRSVRIVAVLAFVGADVSVRRIATFLGISHMQVERDSHAGNTCHYLSNSQVVSGAQSLIHLTKGNGATREEVKAATEWLLTKTQPEAVAAARANKLLGMLDSDLARALELLTHADGLEQADISSLAALSADSVENWRTRLSAACDQAIVLIDSIRKKVPHVTTIN